MSTVTLAPWQGDVAQRARVLGVDAARLAVALCVLAAGSTVVLSLTSDHVELPLATALVKGYYVVAPVLIGLLWLRRRPASRFGPLLIAFAGTGWLLGLQASAIPAVYTLAVMGDFAFLALNIYLCLAFPWGRLTHAIDRVLIGTVVFALVQFAVPWLLFAPSVEGGGPLSRCGPDCPPNPFQIAADPGVLAAAGRVEIALGVAAVLGVLVRMLWRMSRATRPQRRALVGVLASSALLILPFAAFHLTREFAPDARAARDTLSWIVVGARILFPLGFLAVLLQADAFAAAAQRRLMDELAAGTTPRGWQAAVSRALDDPDLRLGFWDPRSRTYRDAGGAELAPPADGAPDRRYLVQRDRRPVAVIDADATLLEDPELVAAAASATLVAVERGDLVGALRASRARLVAAADAERSRLHRDLHDGAQQRLVALRVRVGLAAETAEDREHRAELEQFGAELDTALREVRELARGIYPRALSEYGVAEALRAGPARVRVVERGFGRLAPAIENAVYFTCLEAIQNAAKHAPGAQTVRVELAREGDRARFDVIDDGPGFDPASADLGSGLVNMTDRIEAIGGTLRIESAPGAGCRVAGSVPCADSPSPDEA